MPRLVLLLALAALVPVPAQAQSPEVTSSMLAVKPGEKLIVTRTTHETLRGRVLRVADDGLVIEDGVLRETVALGDLERVERPKDRIWNGMLIGYGVGFATGALLVLSDPCHPDPNAFIDLHFCGPEFAFGMGAIITGPIGMAVGTISDALIRRPHVVFDRHAIRRAAIQATPVIRRGGGGVRVAVAF